MTDFSSKRYEPLTSILAEKPLREDDSSQDDFDLDSAISNISWLDGVKELGFVGDYYFDLPQGKYTQLSKVPDEAWLKYYMLKKRYATAHRHVHFSVEIYTDYLEDQTVESLSPDTQFNVRVFCDVLFAQIKCRVAHLLDAVTAVDRELKRPLDVATIIERVKRVCKGEKFAESLDKPASIEYVALVPVDELPASVKQHLSVLESDSEETSPGDEADAGFADEYMSVPSTNVGVRKVIVPDMKATACRRAMHNVYREEIGSLYRVSYLHYMHPDQERDEIRIAGEFTVRVAENVWAHPQYGIPVDGRIRSYWPVKVISAEVAGYEEDGNLVDSLDDLNPNYLYMISPTFQLEVAGGSSQLGESGELDMPSKAEVNAAAAKTETPKSPEQAEAGNYKKGHILIGGLDVTIENAKGSERSGVDKGGKKWSVTMPAHYGYVKGTVGKDGDHVDVYIGDNLDSDTVWVVDQLDAETGDFDEHKCLLGFEDEEAARSTYLDGFSDGKGKDRLGGVAEMTFEEFKLWLGSNETKEPASDLDESSGSQSDNDEDIDADAYIDSTFNLDAELPKLGFVNHSDVGWTVSKESKDGEFTRVITVFAGSPNRDFVPYHVSLDMIVRLNGAVYTLAKWSVDQFSVLDTVRNAIRIRDSLDESKVQTARGLKRCIAPGHVLGRLGFSETDGKFVREFELSEGGKLSISVQAHESKVPGVYSVSVLNESVDAAVASFGSARFVPASELAECVKFAVKASTRHAVLLEAAEGESENTGDVDAFSYLDEFDIGVYLKNNGYSPTEGLGYVHYSKLIDLKLRSGAVRQVYVGFRQPYKTKADQFVNPLDALVVDQDFAGADEDWYKVSVCVLPVKGSFTFHKMASLPIHDAVKTIESAIEALDCSDLTYENYDETRDRLFQQLRHAWSDLERRNGLGRPVTESAVNDPGDLDAFDYFDIGNFEKTLQLRGYVKEAWYGAETWVKKFQLRTRADSASIAWMGFRPTSTDSLEHVNVNPSSNEEYEVTVFLGTRPNYLVWNRKTSLSIDVVVEALEAAITSPTEAGEWSENDAGGFALTGNRLIWELDNALSDLVYKLTRSVTESDSSDPGDVDAFDYISTSDPENILKARGYEHNNTIYRIFNKKLNVSCADGRVSTATIRFFLHDNDAYSVYVILGGRTMDSVVWEFNYRQIPIDEVADTIESSLKSVNWSACRYRHLRLKLSDALNAAAGELERKYRKKSVTESDSSDPDAFDYLDGSAENYLVSQGYVERQKLEFVKRVTLKPAEVAADITVDLNSCYNGRERGYENPDEPGFNYTVSLTVDPEGAFIYADRVTSTPPQTSIPALEDYLERRQWPDIRYSAVVQTIARSLLMKALDVVESKAERFVSRLLNEDGEDPVDSGDSFSAHDYLRLEDPMESLKSHGYTFDHNFCAFFKAFELRPEQVPARYPTATHILSLISFDLNGQFGRPPHGESCLDFSTPPNLMFLMSSKPTCDGDTAAEFEFSSRIDWVDSPRVVTRLRNHKAAGVDVTKALLPDILDSIPDLVATIEWQSDNRKEKRSEIKTWLAGVVYASLEDLGGPIGESEETTSMSDGSLDAFDYIDASEPDDFWLKLYGYVRKDDAYVNRFKFNQLSLSPKTAVVKLHSRPSLRAYEVEVSVHSDDPNEEPTVVKATTDMDVLKLTGALLSLFEDSWPLFDDHQAYGIVSRKLSKALGTTAESQAPVRTDKSAVTESSQPDINESIDDPNQEVPADAENEVVGDFTDYMASSIEELKRLGYTNRQEACTYCKFFDIPEGFTINEHSAGKVAVTYGFNHSDNGEPDTSRPCMLSVYLARYESENPADWVLSTLRRLNYPIHYVNKYRELNGVSPDPSATLYERLVTETARALDEAIPKVEPPRRQSYLSTIMQFSQQIQDVLDEVIDRCVEESVAAGKSTNESIGPDNDDVDYLADVGGIDPTTFNLNATDVVSSLKSGLSKARKDYADAVGVPFYVDMIYGVRAENYAEIEGRYLVTVDPDSEVQYLDQLTGAQGEVIEPMWDVLVVEASPDDMSKLEGVSELWVYGRFYEIRPTVAPKRKRT